MPNAKAAADIAVCLWKIHYNVNVGMPLIVKYIEEEDLWAVSTDHRLGYFGGHHATIKRTTGEFVNIEQAR